MAETVTKLPTQPIKHPIAFQLGDTTIDGVVIKPLSFSTFVECIAAAQLMTQPTLFEARLRRLRMLRQVTYYSGNAVIQMTPENVLKLPIPAARTITAHLDDNEGEAGKVIRDGDGIDKAITFELGTPIQVGAGKPPIKELEFQASTYGDIEDVMASPDSLSQASQLISTVAKPLGTTLQQLPSWALTQITVADGVTIAKDVLPRFLGSPGES